MKRAPTSPSLRILIDRIFRTTTDLDTFILDCFPEVHRNFPSGMTRQDRLNQLFAQHAGRLEVILDTLQEHFPQQVAQHQGVLRLEPMPALLAAGEAGDREQADGAGPSSETPNHGAKYPGDGAAHRAGAARRRLDRVARWGAAVVAGALVAGTALALSWPAAVPALPRGGLLVATRRGDLPWIGSTWKPLCEGLAREDRGAPPRSACTTAPVLPVSTESLGRTLAQRSGAALVALLQRDASLLLLPREQGELPIHTLRIPAGQEGEPAETARLRVLALRELARLSGGAVDAPLTALPEILEEHLDTLGPELTLLIALLRLYHYGVPPAGSDPELRPLEALWRRCQAASGGSIGRERSEGSAALCPLAGYLYGVHCVECEGADAALRKAMQDAPSARLRMLAGVERMRRACPGSPATAAEALTTLHAELRGALRSCAERLIMLGVATCALRAPLQPAVRDLALELSAPDAERFVGCPADLIARGLQERALQRALAGEWAQAATDYGQAYGQRPLPEYLLDRAECLLHLPGSEQQIADVLRLDRFPKGSQMQVRAAFLRWLALPSEREARRLLESYERLTERADTLADYGGTLRQLACARQQRACQTFDILSGPRGARSLRDLERSLLGDSRL